MTAGARGLRRVLAAMRRWPQADSRVDPETVFLVAGLEPEAQAVFEALPQELKAWRLLADMEAARGRVWLKEGRVWDAGLSTGRALAFREAAAGVEAMLIGSLELTRGGGRGR